MAKSCSDYLGVIVQTIFWQQEIDRYHLIVSKEIVDGFYYFM